MTERNRKLAAASSRDKTALPDSSFNPFRRFLQETVAKGMSERIVNDFKSGQFEHKQSNPCFP